MFPGLPRQQPDGQCRRVAERLGKMPHQRREDVEDLRASGERAMPSSEVVRDALGVAALVERGFGEAERERLRLPGAVTRGDGRHQARIDAAAQEQTEWHVTAEPECYRGREQSFQSIDGLGEAPGE